MAVKKIKRYYKVCHLVQGIRLSGGGWKWRRFLVFNGSLGEQVNMISACGQLITPGSLTTWMVLQPCKNKQVKHIYLYIPTCWDICWVTIQNGREKYLNITKCVTLFKGFASVVAAGSGAGSWSSTGASANRSTLDGPATLQKQTSEACTFIYPYMLGYMLGYHSKWP